MWLIAGFKVETEESGRRGGQGKTMLCPEGTGKNVDSLLSMMESHQRTSICALELPVWLWHGVGVGRGRADLMHADKGCFSLLEDLSPICGL